LKKPGRNVAAKAGLNRRLLDSGFGLLARLIAEKTVFVNAYAAITAASSG
jgi:hypothetical protein